MSEVNAPPIGHPGMSIPHGMDLSGLSGEVSVAHAEFQDSWISAWVHGDLAKAWGNAQMVSVDTFSSSEMHAAFLHASHACFAPQTAPHPHLGIGWTRSVFSDRHVSSDDPDFFCSFVVEVVRVGRPRFGWGCSGRTGGTGHAHETGKSKASFRIFVTWGF